MLLRIKKASPVQGRLFYIWRRARDSNPRYCFQYTPLAGVRLQPLGQLSNSLLKALYTDNLYVRLIPDSCPTPFQGHDDIKRSSCSNCSRQFSQPLGQLSNLLLSVSCTVNLYAPYPKPSFMNITKYSIKII